MRRPPDAFLCATCGEPVPHDGGERCPACGQPALLRSPAGAEYRLEAEVGRGAFGATYRASDLRDGRIVAIKQVPVENIDTDKERELIEREARVLAQLDHPAIPDFVEHFQGGVGRFRSLYLVQEFIEGQTLAQELEGRRYDLPQVLAILAELLQILDYLHGLKPPVVHRDLKPGNVMRRASGELVLIDFGAVRDILKGALGGSTVAGTFGYMAPEQFMGDASPATDLFCLGMLAVHLLSRVDPAELRRHSPEKVDWKPHVHVPDGVEALLEGLLRPDPGRRPRSAKLVLKRVRRLLRNPEAQEPEASPPRPAPSTQPWGGPPARRPLASTLGRLSFAVLAGVGLSAALSQVLAGAGWRHWSVLPGALGLHAASSFAFLWRRAWDLKGVRQGGVHAPAAAGWAVALILSWMVVGFFLLNFTLANAIEGNAASMQLVWATVAVGGACLAAGSPIRLWSLPPAARPMGHRMRLLGWVPQGLLLLVALLGACLAVFNPALRWERGTFEVEEVQGDAPVAVGGTCQVRLAPAEGHFQKCYLRLTCGGERLFRWYGGGSFRCTSTWKDGHLVGLQGADRSLDDGDPRWTFGDTAFEIEREGFLLKGHMRFGE